MSQAAIGQVLAHGADPAVLKDYGMAAGTLVLTLDGLLPVDHLMPGDRIVTRAGAQRLAAVEVTRIEQAAVVRIGAGSLAAGVPAADLVLAAEQPLLVQGWRASALYGAPAVQLAAARLADGRSICAETAPDIRFYALRFARDAVIFADGAALCCAAVRVAA